ncbi:MAG: N-acetylneuraminate synthase family protein [Candidatus Marisimplicoccus sp.]|tara:strand:- start:16734 stop:17606 length:873 start_codon:yes stop_codon:yes gene_type:complete
MIKYKKPIIVAEIGCNHMGQLDIAYELIDLAKNSGADFAKFQKRNNKELLSKNEYESPHPNPINSYGSTYGEHREKLEFSIDSHHKLKKYCEEKGIGYSVSVWDLKSAEEVVKLNPEYIKIPSAMNNHHKLLEYLINNYDGQIHISTGMTYKKELESLKTLFKSKNKLKSLVIYSCTSGYPVEANEVCLMELLKLQKIFKDEIFDYAFSGHHKGIAIDISAYTLGATWIERHFTKDRTWKGTDHAASLEAPGMSKLSRNLNTVYDALKFKTQEILDIEKPQRNKLKFKNQ